MMQWNKLKIKIVFVGAQFNHWQLNPRSGQDNDKGRMIQTVFLEHPICCFASLCSFYYFIP